MSGDTILTGDLTVNGTTTTVNTETINLADNNIVLNSNETGTPTENGGITVERGTSDNALWQWNETLDRWEAKVGTSFGDIYANDLRSHSCVITNGTITTFTSDLVDINSGNIDRNIHNGNSNNRCYYNC